MKTKWYFGALLIVFTLLGVYQNQVSEPNQQIVVQFTNVSITSDEAKSTITTLKKQLEALGATKVQVKDLKSGQLKITYYCDANVKNVKEILSNESHFALKYASNNTSKSSNKTSDKDSKNYKFDVFEIHKTTDIQSGLDGKCVLNFKQDFDRFYNPNVYIFSEEINNKEKCYFVKVAYKIRRNIAITIDNISGNIPEVRAGPDAFGNV